MKEQLFDELINSMADCKKCMSLEKKNGRNCSLINIYQNNKFCKNIPSIWTDWFNRLDSKIMIIGQDWGPYNDMKKLNISYMESPTKDNWKSLIEQERSTTKKMLEYYIKESSNGKYNLDKIFITNAIMCARYGDNYRGDNIYLKKSTINCQEFLQKQIEIVKPRVILTLGYYPLLSLSKSFQFDIDKTLSSTIIKNPEIKINDFVIIPLYHPVAQVKKTIQLEQYKRIWKYIDNEVKINETIKSN